MRFLLPVMASLLIAGMGFPASAQDSATLLLNCAKLAGSPFDHQRPDGVEGVARGDIDVAKAVPACSQAHDLVPNDAGAAFNLGRSLAAGGSEQDLPRMAALYRQAADAGYVVGMINYGQALELGLGVAIDFVGAVKYYRLAAEAGHPLAARNLAFMLDAGRGTQQDHVEAAKWLQVAVDGGDATAMRNLGLQYENGSGVPRDYAKARHLYERAIDLGETAALTDLGWLYDRGLGGLPIDHVKANVLFRQAADAGEPQGMNNLGESLLLGEGIAKDEPAGLVLIGQAYDLENPMAAYNLATYYATGKYVTANASKAAGYYLDAIKWNSDDVSRVLIEDAGANLGAEVLSAIEAEMRARGLKFEPGIGRLSTSAINALKSYAAP